MDSEGAAGYDPPHAVSHSIVALICLCHSLCHPGLPVHQLPPARIAGFRICPVPQHDWHGLRWSTPGNKLKYGGIFRDVVPKVLPVLSVVGLNAL